MLFLLKARFQNPASSKISSEALCAANSNTAHCLIASHRRLELVKFLFPSGSGFLYHVPTNRQNVAGLYYLYVSHECKFPLQPPGLNSSIYKYTSRQNQPANRAA
jgi:hypothetical protein